MADGTLRGCDFSIPPWSSRTEVATLLAVKAVLPGGRSRAARWSLMTLREKLVKIGARVIREFVLLQHRSNAVYRKTSSILAKRP